MALSLAKFYWDVQLRRAPNYPPVCLMDLISSVYTHTHTLNKSLQSVKRPALFRQTPVVSVIQYQSMAQKFPGVKGHTQSEVGNTSHGEQINTQIKAWVVCYGFKLNMTKYADFRVLSCLSCFPSSMFFCTKILVKCESCFQPVCGSENWSLVHLKMVMWGIF